MANCRTFISVVQMLYGMQTRDAIFRSKSKAISIKVSQTSRPKN